MSILADCIGALFAYGALCSQTGTSSDLISVDSLLVNYAGDNLSDSTSLNDPPFGRLQSTERSLSADSTNLSQLSLVRSQKQFEFDVTNFFCCGSPIGMILMKQFFESNGCMYINLLSFLSSPIFKTKATFALLSVFILICLYSRKCSYFFSLFMLLFSLL